MADDIPPLPALADLHERHYGITEAIARNYAEGAAICLQRHHAPPIVVTVVDADRSSDYVSVWNVPTGRQRAAWENQDDATRDGAYGMVIAASEAHFGYFVVGRARTGTGSDYLLSLQPPEPAFDEDLDFQEIDLYRLEVSGIDRCSGESQLDARLHVKLQQLRDGRSTLPGMAAVVAFNLARIKFAKL
jgi:hypothetical protein